MDLSSLGLDEDTQVKILELHESDVKELKNKNYDLIGRIKGAKERSEELERAALESAEAVENAKVALAEKEGDLVKYKDAVAERDENLAAIQREFKEKDSQRLMSDAKNNFSKVVADDKASQHYMVHEFENSVEVVEGVVRPKDSNLTLEQLTARLISDEANSSYVKAPVGSGSGAAGSFSGSATTGKASFSGTKQERVNAAVVANPKLANLPIR